MLSTFGLFPLEFETVDKNLKKRVSLSEFFALMLAISTVGISIWSHGLSQGTPYDYGNYISAARGDFTEFYYGYWILPLISIFAYMPSNVGYFLWAVVNIMGVWFAARIFGGNIFLVLLSYQIFYVVFYGQISGLIIGMIALAYWGILQKKWDIAGIGFLIAASKYQTGLLMGAILWLLVKITWRDKLRILLIPAIGVLLSFIIYPNWLFISLERTRALPPNDWGSISLWGWIGPISLLIFIPVIFLPMEWRQRFLAASAACALGLPYFQQADLINLLVFPLGWLPLLGNLGFLYYWFQWDALKLLTVVPLVLYLLIVVPAGAQMLRNRVQRIDSGSSGQR